MSASARVPWKRAPDGLLVSVRATPKGGRDTIDGIDDLADGNTVLKARIRAAPADGEANRALIKLLAKTINAAPSTVSLVRGATGRIKVFRLAGDPSALAASFEKALAGIKKRNE